MNAKREGFTLVEVMVASTIGAFISLVAVGTLKTVITSNEHLDNNINAASEARFAANLLQRDLTNIYRDENTENTKLIGSVEYLAEYSTSYLVFYTINRTKARAYEPESDLYEVEYYLMKEDDKSALIRRVWPNPSDEFEPGGIRTTIAENIDLFEVRYFDGEEWYNDWPEDMETLPHIIEVNIVAKPLTGVPILETFIVNLTRTVASSTTEEQAP
ncbi:MAG: prepilin-type N-terminal cleavage/methylation domain-containing protein [Sedimentisphaerales bacterium]|nr:prepilin-type N-terminal cleavage/methylation domain-containing protein [Sedimentisphaerales bacterium]